MSGLNLMSTSRVLVAVTIAWMGAPSKGLAQNFGGAPTERTIRAEGSNSPLSPEQRDKFAAAKPEDITSENFPETIESFDYPNADIEDVIKAMAELTGKNFIIDSGVRGKITIIAPTKITVADAWRAFLTALALNGFTIIPSGSFLKIRTIRNGLRDSLDTYAGDYFPNSDQLITRIIHLKHISAVTVQNELRILISKDGEFEKYAATNSLVITDIGSNVERIERILKALDVPGFEEKMEVMPVFHAKAVDIATLIDKILNKDSSPSGGGTAARSRFRTARPPSIGGAGGDTGGSSTLSYTVIPDERSNALVVVGNKPGLERIRTLLKALDFPLSPEDAGGVHVYYIKHGSAEEIATTLNGIAEKTKAEQEKAAGGAPTNRLRPLPQDGFDDPYDSGGSANGQVFGGNVGITADKTTNSLIVTASRQDFEAVLNLLSKIDIPRDQVFVEAVILEMNLKSGEKFGASLFSFNKESKGLARQSFNGLGADLPGIATSAIGGLGTVLSFGAGERFNISPGPGQPEIEVSSVLGLINLLKTNENANVLSTPQIIAMDNEEAEIEVGDRIPIGAQVNTTNTNLTTQAPIFEDATIKLKIKPFISPDSEMIRMEVDQQIQEPLAPVNGGTPIAKRSIKTKLVLESGSTAVLGGLMQDKVTETERKVPLLGDIPILGWLFRSTDESRTKVNLLVFLTPKIIRNGFDQRKNTNTKISERIDFIKRANGVDSYGYKMEKIARDVQASEDAALARGESPTAASRSNKSNTLEPTPKKEATPNETPLELAPEDIDALDLETDLENEAG